MGKAKKTLSIEEVKHVADLAKLDLSEKEFVKFRKQLSDVVDFISKIDELDIKNVTPTSQTTGLENIFRDDITTPSLTQEEVLANAPSKYKGYFKVKAIFNEE